MKLTYYKPLSTHAFDCNLRSYTTGRLPASLWDETLDDGDGGYGKIPYLPARHDRPAMSEERTVNLGLNPFFCPLPAWADEVHATCRQAEMTGLEPSMGPAQGGTRVRPCTQYCLTPSDTGYCSFL